MHTSDTKGQVILFMIVTMTIAAILGAGMVYLFSSSTSSGLLIHNRHKAYYLAEAGRQYATMIIDKANFDADLQTIMNLDKQTFTVDDGQQFYLTTKIVKAGVTLVESTGIANSNTFWETKQKIAFTVKDKTLIEGVAAIGNISLNSGSFIDGYDSSVAPYVFNPNGLKAIVQTNSISAGAIELNGTNKDPCIIYGTALCGVGCDTDVAIETNRFALIKGERKPATKNYAAPVLTIPTGGTNITLLGASGQNTDITTTDKYRARSVTGSTDVVLNDATLTIKAGQIVTLIIDGSLTLYNSSQIILESNAILILWVKTKLEVGGTSKVNYQQSPTNVLIKGIAMTELAFVNNSRTYCAIYAPGSNLKIDRTSEIFGSVFAGNIGLYGGNLHLDMAFSQSTATGY